MMEKVQKLWTIDIKVFNNVYIYWKLKVGNLLKGKVSLLISPVK